MEQAWKYYENPVGMWTIESGPGVHRFPLKTKGLDMESVAREFFHYFDGVTRAFGDFFMVTSIQYPPGKPVLESSSPLDLREAKEKLLRAWEGDVKGCEIWAPGAILKGLTDVAVQADGRVVSAQLPQVLIAMLSAVPGSDRYAIILVTNCDIWLNRAISGADNPIGAANAPRLAETLRKLEDALDGKVVYFNTEYDVVAVNEHGFGLGHLGPGQ